jgi:hypothetical protein
MNISSSATGIIVQSLWSLISPHHIASVFKSAYSLYTAIKKFRELRKTLKSKYGEVGSSLRRFGAGVVDGVTGFVLKTGFSIITLGHDDFVNLTSKVAEQVQNLFSSWTSFPANLVDKIQGFASRHPDLTTRPASLRYIEDKAANWVDTQYRESGLISDTGNWAVAKVESTIRDENLVADLGPVLADFTFESALKYDRPLPSCYRLTRGFTYILCNECNGKMYVGTYHRTYHTRSLFHFSLSWMLKMKMNIANETDCCRCRNDNYDLCHTCYMLGLRCPGKHAMTPLVRESE